MHKEDADHPVPD